MTSNSTNSSSSNNSMVINAFKAGRRSAEQEKMLTPTTSVKRRTAAPFTKLVTEANRMFAYQLEKSNETKWKCLEHELASFKDVTDVKLDYIAECTRMMDFRPYMKECEFLGIKPLTLATHIALRGKTCIARVLKEGIVATIGEDYKMYDKDFLPEEFLKMSADYSAENCESFKTETE